MKRQDGTSGSRTYFAAYPMRVVLTVFVCAALGMSGLAEAQNNRGIGIGLGVAGALIVLDKLSTGKGKKSRSSANSYSKKSKSTSKKKSNDAGQTRSAKQNSGMSSRTAAKTKSLNKNDQVGARPEENNSNAGQPGTTTKSLGAGSVASPNAPIAPPVPVTPSPKLAAPVQSQVISTPAEIATAQDHLRFLGYDIKSNNGTLDLNTKIATMKYQESIGAPSTGHLTVEQLQSLFFKAAEKQKSN